MIKQIQEISRYRRKQRSTKNAVLVICEGRNKTELNYLENFKRREMKYRPIFKPCESTDVKSMTEKANFIREREGLSTSDGDKIFVLVDLDLDKNKESQITELKSKYNDITFITSNPCFEVWFILHFEHCPVLNSSKDTKKHLKKFIPNYEEGRDVYSSLDINTAINQNSILRKSIENCGYTIGTIDANPHTQIDKLIFLLLEND